MKRLALLAALVAALLTGHLDTALAKRIAIVVGNNDYPNLDSDNQLATAINDARAVRNALKTLDFDVIYGENLDRNAFEDKIFEFYGRISPGDIALFYYAGHGVGIAGGNYFLPVDIKPPQSNRKQEESRLKKKSIAEFEVIRGMKDAGARIAVAVLDACRNNPLTPSDGGRAVGASRGLQRMALSRGVFSIYSAGFGEKALDRLPGEPGNGNSVFTRVFVKKLVTPGLNLSELARATRNEVDRLASAAGRIQTPAFYDQIVGDPVYLAGRGNDAKKVARVPDKGPAPVPVNPDSKIWLVQFGYFENLAGARKLKQALEQKGLKNLQIVQSGDYPKLQKKGNYVVYGPLKQTEIEQYLDAVKNAGLTPGQYFRKAGY